MHKVEVTTEWSLQLTPSGRLKAMARSCRFEQANMDRALMSVVQILPDRIGALPEIYTYWCSNHSAEHHIDKGGSYPKGIVVKVARTIHRLTRF